MFQIQPRKFLVALMLLSLLFFSWGAKAQFPDRPITLVVPYGPGSAIDAVARALGVGAQKSLGQQVIIENKSGAGGALGAVYAGRKPADGYTLAVISINPFVLSYFSKAMPLHPVDDFTQVISTSLYLMAVAVRSDSKIKDMSELMEQIKNNPGKLTYSTAGIASTGFLNMEEFSALAKIKPVHVPYKSGAEAVSAVLAGHVDFFADAAWAPFHKDGRMRPLMIFANERSSKYPTIPVPTDIVKANVQQGYLMIVGPKNIPAPVVQRLHDAFKAALDEPEYKTVIDRFNMESIYAGPEASRKATAAAMPALEEMFITLGLGKQ
jgi:tripartite-type tricarboxylate transporter receptor subunit TctC